jgi:hypothetical protein
MKNISKLSEYKFTVSLSDSSDNLVLNFQPLINFFNLHLLYEEFVLCHWRAKVDRNFGWYDFLTRQYYAIDWNNIKISAAKSIPIQVNETVLPSAVILYPNAHLVKSGSNWNLVNEQNL